MTDTLITYVQVFGIGFSFGIIGPCFFTCAPVLITYVAGTQKRFFEALFDIISFLAGRLTGYCILGFAAGMSGLFIRQISSPPINFVFKFAAGAVSILLGLSVLLNRPACSGSCGTTGQKARGLTGLFLFGFVIGVSPCAPLLALLFEIALMSKRALDGFMYALFFGLGTLLSGLVVVGAAAGIFSWIPARFLHSKKLSFAFKIFCSALLILLGIAMIIQKKV